MSEAGKPYTKKEANYRKSTSSEEGACYDCQHFNMRDDTCDLVEGKVKREDTCNLFAPKLEDD